MAVKFPLELQGVKDGTVPPGIADGRFVGGGLRRFRSTIEMASSGNGAVTSADAVALGVLPANTAFAYGVLTTDTSLAGASVAIGSSDTHATNGQMRAADTFTSTDTPTLFGNAGALAAAPVGVDVPLFLTTSASLPTSGTLVVDIYISGAN